MPAIELAPEVGDDFDRVLQHLARHDVVNPQSRIREILEAIDVLATNPLIGRRVVGDLRELIIGRRARGYVALYRYVPEVDVVFVLAIRSQHEVGYNRD